MPWTKLSVDCVILTSMTPCNVQKCTNAANENLEPLLIAGPLCDEHRARLIDGEDWELQGTEQSPIGMSQPTVLMDDSLRSLNQYVLLEPPHTISTGNPRHGNLVPLRVHRRGDPNETELMLTIPRDMLPAIADFFQHVAEGWGKRADE